LPPGDAHVEHEHDTLSILALALAARVVGQFEFRRCP
jgi:hypothetical protein